MSSFKNFCLVCILTVLLICKLILLSPVYVFRGLLSVIPIQKLWSRKLVKIVHLQSSVYGDCNGSSPVNGNVLVYLVVKGALNYEEIVERICSNTLFAKDEKNGKYLFPEFQQHIVDWAGYPFWTNDENFRIEDHIMKWTPRNEKILDERLLYNLALEMNLVDFQPGTSPWFIKFVENVQISSSNENPEFGYGIFFKFHHTLADGHAMFNAIMNCADTPVKRYEPKGLKLGFFKIFLSGLTFVFGGGPSLFVKLGQGSKTKEVFESLTPPVKRGPFFHDISEKPKRFYARSRPISIGRISKVGRSVQSSLSSVILYAITGGLRKFMLGRNPPEKVPEYITGLSAAPIHEHAKGMSNSFSLVYLKFPTGATTSESRLKLCKLEANSFRNPAMMHLWGYFNWLTIGGLPFALRGKTVQRGTPIVISSFPGPLEAVVLDSNEVIDATYLYESKSNFPFAWTVFSYNGKIKITVNMDSTFIDEVCEAEELIKQIENEFDELEELVRSGRFGNEASMAV